MAHYLNASQLAEDACELGLTDVVTFLEMAAQKAAEDIAKHRGISVTVDAATEPGFAGLCVGFGPLKKGDKCPDDFTHYDDSSGWAQGEEE